MIGQRHYESVKAKLDEALAGGASCLPPFDGTCKPNDSDMTLPFTALLETAASSSVFSTEIFGPILPIVQVDNVQEAIEMVRRVPTGTPLISYCYSSDAASAEAFEAGTSSGMLVVNGGPQRIQANYNVAFGGAGASGFGVHMWGRRALEEFSHTRHVCIAKDGGFAKSFFSGPPKPPSQ
jgi:acyl-CoA reductase-like NAD-dependent aldehyde dehydrogenase